MTQIKFSPDELSELQLFYKQEYNKALKRLTDLKSILSKLKTNGTNGSASTTEHAISAAPVSTAKKRGRPARKQTVVKVASAPTAKKRGRPAQTRTVAPVQRRGGKWRTFILDSLSSDKSLRAKDMYPTALKQFNAKGKTAEKRALVNLHANLARMQKYGDLKAEKKSGQPGTFYRIA